MNEFHQSEETNFDIAIIGMAGRFPGAKNLDEFWQNLKDGKESIKFFTDEELLEAGVAPELIKDPNYIKASPVMDDPDLFDASFFGYAPREAQFMDPQHRLFLESSWEALESSGYDAHKYEGRIGVFGGMAMNTYLLSTGHVTNFFKEYLPTLLGSDKDFLTTRVSYKMNLTGPSVSVQTACSSSLVAIHLACQSLINEEADMAIVGGVAVKVPQVAGYTYEEQSVFSPDGHCRPFDAEAKGTIFGSGVGTVVLKRYDDALADNDTIHALIKGSAINNDGSSKIDYTAPSVNSQCEAIIEAIGVAGVSADSISYVEAHGTGTYLGDPIEVAALSKAFRQDTDKKGFCAIGSVKSNIGHLDAAAGVTGLIKTVLSMKNRQLPPSINYKKPNPEIDFENSPFYVNDTLSTWQGGDGQPLRAGITSLGMGGTNAHVILEEAPLPKPTAFSKNPQIITFSARNKKALDQQCHNLGVFLQKNQELSLADVAFTLQQGRRDFEYRAVAVCENIAEAVKATQNFEAPIWSKSKQSPGSKELILMFSGQGSQYVDMAKGLYEIYPKFRETVDECAEILKPILKEDIRDLIYPVDAGEKEATEKLKQTRITQPALFTIEYALFKLWEAWEIKPNALVGHSIGEYVAACAAGVFSLADALKIVAKRGELMQSLPEGSMASIPLPEAEVLKFLNEQISVSVINTPHITVVSGETKAIEELIDTLKKQDIEAKLLRTSHAFHSVMMDPILKEFSDFLERVTFNTPTIPFVSNVTGGWINSEQAQSPQYWADHIRNTVRFSDNIATLCENENHIFLECGPGQTLTSFVRQHPQRNKTQAVIASTRHPKEEESDNRIINKALGALWLADFPIEWNIIHEGTEPRRILLPTYPFQGKSHWIQQPKALTQEGGLKPMDEWFYFPSWVRKPMMSHPESSKENPIWCLVTNGSSWDDEFAKTFVSGAPDATIISSPKDAPLSEKDFQEFLDSIEDYERPLHCIYLNTRLEEVSTGPERIERSLENGFKGLINVVRSLYQNNLSNQIKVSIITHQSSNVTGGESIIPEASIVEGLALSMAQEIPNLQSQTIDLSQDSLATESVMLQVKNEMNAHRLIPRVAYRGTVRWEISTPTIKLAEASANGRSMLKKDGVYLITGGLGNLGLQLALSMGDLQTVKMVLIGRSEFPHKSDWAQLLQDQKTTDTVKQKIRALQEIESKGSEVLVLKADVSDFEQMQAVFNEINVQYGSLQGVIHAAGVTNETAFKEVAQTDNDLIDLHFKSKVQGVFVLDKLLATSEVDFCMLTSSISSLLGGIGFGVYAASNIFNDRFAESKRMQGLPWISVNWDAWEFGTTPEPLAISPAEGREIFARLMTDMNTQIVVSTHDLDYRLNKWLNPIISTDDLSIVHGDQNPEEDFQGPRNEMEEKISEIWCKRMGMKQIDIYDNYFDWGGNSLIGTQIIADINKLAKINLNIKDMFSAPTVAALAELVNERIGGVQDTQNKLEELLKKVQGTSN